jgi:hypothetical protein
MTAVKVTMSDLHKQAVAEIYQYLKQKGGTADYLQTVAEADFNSAKEAVKAENRRQGRMNSAQQVTLESYAKVAINIPPMPNLKEFPELLAQQQILMDMIVQTNLMLPAAMLHIHSTQMTEFHLAHVTRLVKLFTDAHVTQATAEFLAQQYTVANKKLSA